MAYTPRRTRNLTIPRCRCIHPYTLVLIVFVTVLTTTYTTLFGSDKFQHSIHKIVQRVERLTYGRETWQLVQPNCKIPVLPKLPNSYLQSRGQKPLDQELRNCYKNQEIALLLEDDMLVLQLEKEDWKCCAREIYREDIDLADSYKVSNSCETFVEDKILNVSHMEFILVECTNSTQPENSTKLYGFYANVPLRKPKLAKKAKKWNHRDLADIPDSIFVLAIDSASRTELFRNIPQTMEFLVKNLGFIDFKGHHPIGEPTIRNMAPLFFGMSYEEFLKHSGKEWVDSWDAAPFIWKLYNQLNYVTGYFEDLPRMATFNYFGQQGFLRQPVDLYTRPLMLAHEITYRDNGRSICMGKKTTIEFMLDYHLRTLKRLKDVPSFLISWPTWPWHDIPSSLQLHDSDFLNFFQKISTEDHILSRTWLIVMADHAFYADPFAKTHEGLLERRNIPLLIRPPDRAVERNPEILQNLEYNSDILTSHFDVFNMLYELAKGPDGKVVIEDTVNVTSKGQSLLSELEPDRTCDDAGIPAIMCACNLPAPGKEVDSENATVDPALFIKFCSLPC